MGNNTKNGLLIILIGLITGIIGFFIFGFYQILFPIENPENFLQYIFIGIIGGISGFISLIGAILFFNGRKEFGGKHQKFVSYALICIAVVILFSIITAFANSFIFSAFAIDDSSLISISTIIILPIIISAFFGGLVYFFALYHLEDDIGRKILYIAFIVSILVSIYIAYISAGSIEKLIQDLSNDPENFAAISSMTSEITRNSFYGSISSILWSITVYLPYKRIKNGDLMPHSKDIMEDITKKVCSYCNKSIPHDSNNCPYCGNQFKKP